MGRGRASAALPHASPQPLRNGRHGEELGTVDDSTPVAVDLDGHRNPVTYLSDPDAGDPACACGCGAPVSGNRSFLPGHDQRAVHERIARQWGSTLAFMDWFDATYPAAR